MIKKYPDRAFIPGKINAFTLLEAIIALMLSFFILGFLILLYNLMVRQTIDENRKDFSAIQLLNSGLRIDFFHADTILSEDNSIKVFIKGMELRYLLQNKAILRKADLNVDTLYRGDYQLKVYSSGENKWINRLDIRLKTKDEEISLVFRKSYLPNLKLKHKEIHFEY